MVKFQFYNVQICVMPPVAELSRRAYPALLERSCVGSIPANSDAQHVSSFRRWRFEVKLSLFVMFYLHNIISPQ